MCARPDRTTTSTPVRIARPGGRGPQVLFERVSITGAVGFHVKRRETRNAYRTVMERWNVRETA